MTRAGEGFWRTSWRRFRRSHLATLALIYVVLVTAMAILAPLLANRRPLVVRTAHGFSFPAGGDYWVNDTDVERRLPPGRPLVTAPVPFSPNSVDVVHRLEPPSRRHRFGTDDLGRDVLARMIHGAPITLIVGFSTTATDQLLD